MAIGIAEGFIGTKELAQLAQTPMAVVRDAVERGAWPPAQYGGWLAEFVTEQTRYAARKGKTLRDVLTRVVYVIAEPGATVVVAQRRADALTALGFHARREKHAVHVVVPVDEDAVTTYRDLTTITRHIKAEWITVLHPPEIVERNE